ncbi:shikimate dehydrogenase [Variovorax rhizosphaerae]|uniref:Shikimate dehydrogenase n=1 Tax=Variovorax rhizosphaerae TaxID=1836200 RepID=A0ABU8WMY9_9BURK
MTSGNPPIAGDTRLFAIIGDPIAQAKSPALFNRLFTELGANAVLVPLQVPAAQLSVAIAGLKALANLDGIVVTVPHKVAILEHLDLLGDHAQAVGAANCMRRLPDGRWQGEMYDGAGFVAGLQAQGIQCADQRVFLTGCGGAGKAVAHALAGAGIAAIQLVDSDPQRQHELAQQLRAIHPPLQVSEGGPANTDHDLAINCTPCGMAEGDPLPFPIYALRPDAIVADLIMKPERTPLLLAAEARGHRIHLGRHLLENQAALVTRFFGLQSSHLATVTTPIPGENT